MANLVRQNSVTRKEFHSDDSHQTRMIKDENLTLKTQPRAPLPHFNMSQNAPIESPLHRTKVVSLQEFEL